MNVNIIHNTYIFCKDPNTIIFIEYKKVQKKDLYNKLDKAPIELSTLQVLLPVHYNLPNIQAMNWKLDLTLTNYISSISTHKGEHLQQTLKMNKKVSATTKAVCVWVLIANCLQKATTFTMAVSQSCRTKTWDSAKFLCRGGKKRWKEKLKANFKLKMKMKLNE